MTLRITVLTTDTLHHRYFLRRLARALPTGAEIVANLFETKGYPWSAKAKRHFQDNRWNLWRGAALNPYLQSSWLGLAVDDFERRFFFSDGDMALPAGINSHRVRSVNDDEAKRLIEAARPDVLLVYGTGKIQPHVFKNIPLGAINAHGGQVPRYRGLDTNFWAAYEGRPDDISVTLHRIDAEIDTGDVYRAERLRPSGEISLTSLRAHVAVLCTDLFIALLEDMVAGRAKAVPQSGAGAYYGPMPVLLKLRTDFILRAWSRRRAANRAVANP